MGHPDFKEFLEVVINRANMGELFTNCAMKGIVNKRKLHNGDMNFAYIYNYTLYIILTCEQDTI